MVAATTRRLAFGALAAVVSAALVVQLTLWLSTAGGTAAGVLRVLATFLLFFTNLTNLLIAVACGRLAWRFDGVFARPRVGSAVAVYAVVVLIVYELFLRHLWHPTGLVRVTDTIFHDVSPVAFVLLWWAYLRDGTLRPRDVGPWLIGPAAYGGWVLAAAAFAGGVPYGFLGAASVGWPRVGLNVAGLLASFGGVGLAFVAADRLGGRCRGRKPS